MKSHQANGNQKRESVVILISSKVEFNPKSIKLITKDSFNAKVTVHNKQIILINI